MSRKDDLEAELIAAGLLKPAGKLTSRPAPRVARKPAHRPSLAHQRAEVEAVLASEWTCQKCGTDNPIEADRCSGCFKPWSRLDGPGRSPRKPAPTRKPAARDWSVEAVLQELGTAEGTTKLLDDLIAGAAAEQRAKRRKR